MNERLIGEFINQAAQAKEGHRMHTLIALIAERCALICELDKETAPDTIRSAFCPQAPKLKETAKAAARAVSH